MTKSFAAALWATKAAKAAKAAVVIFLIYLSSFVFLIRRRGRSFADHSATGFTMRPAPEAGWGFVATVASEAHRCTLRRK
jgi:hypothetical protein